MSSKKQVIHVKDLIIKADNVIIEPPRRRREHRDPFFGMPLNRQVAEVDEGSDEHVEQREEEGKNRPTTWI